MENQIQWAPFNDDFEARKHYDQVLNDNHETFIVFGKEYPASDVFKNVDPISYIRGFTEWFKTVAANKNKRK